LREGVSGKEFITAFSVGQEVMIRIGMAFRGVSKGWSHGRELGHFIFGATASVGKLLGLSLWIESRGIGECGGYSPWIDAAP
jgi:2-methylcitrate dehydratase PrpD